MLGRELDRPFNYAAYDLHPQQANTRRLNLAETVPSERYDVAFLLGVLEYLPEADGLPRRLRACCEAAVVPTFPATRPRSCRARRATRWRSHLSRAELERSFTEAGFATVSSTIIDEGVTCLWLWSTAG